MLCEATVQLCNKTARLEIEWPQGGGISQRTFLCKRHFIQWLNHMGLGNEELKSTEIFLVNKYADRTYEKKNAK